MVDNLEAPASASAASVHAWREASSNHRVCDRASASHHVECEKSAWHRGFSTSSARVFASSSHARSARTTAETSSPDDFRGFEPGKKNFCKFGRKTESRRRFDAPWAESATVIRTPVSPCATACTARCAMLARSRPRQQTISDAAMARQSSRKSCARRSDLQFALEQIIDRLRVGLAT